MDLRCESGRKHAEFHEGVLEFKCRDRKCGYRDGVVVIHRFDGITGEQLETRRFSEPPEGGKEQHDPQFDSSAVRSA